MLHLSADIIESLHLDTDDDVLLSLGDKKIKVKIIKERYRDNSYFVHHSLRSELNLLGVQQPLAFYFKKTSRELKIGPIIGIFISVPVPMLEQVNASLYKIIAGKAFERGAICYFFTPDFVNFNKRIISGFMYRSTPYSRQEWSIQDFPMPDIIYNQIGIINPELRPLYGKLMKEYSDNRRTVNPFLALNDKLVNHNKLQKYSPVKKFLPETMDCTNIVNIFAFLEKYTSVYLKPTASSRGFGVYKVELMSKDEFLIHYHQTNLEKKIHYLNKRELAEMLELILKEQPYLVQRAIELQQYEERPCIFRVHIFKNAQGRWDIINNTIKLGAVSGVVTGNLWGGYFVAADEHMEKIFGKPASEQILQEMEEAAFKIASAIEKIHNREFGEMGFDFAVDVNNKIWMIEVNPKPNFLAAVIDKTAIEENLAEHLLGCCRHLLHLKYYRTALGFPARE